jgi:hypothetical protein
MCIDFNIRVLYQILVAFAAAALGGKTSGKSYAQGQKIIL